MVETRAKQLKMWTSLVVGFCRATKKTAIDVAGDGDSKMFRNEALRRMAPVLAGLSAAPDSRPHSFLWRRLLVE